MKSRGHFPLLFGHVMFAGAGYSLSRRLLSWSFLSCHGASMLPAAGECTCNNTRRDRPSGLSKRVPDPWIDPRLVGVKTKSPAALPTRFTHILSDLTAVDPAHLAGHRLDFFSGAASGDARLN